MKLTTPYFEKMDRNIPHNYHPTPQFKRDSFICLNGEWDFKLDTNDNYTDYNEKILVPFCPESELSGLGVSVLPKHCMHYRKAFSLPEGFNKGRVILHFGAVDQSCTVYINDVNIGMHTGGYVPFSFDITDELTEGENVIRVDAIDTLDKRLPHGKQKYKHSGMWYTPVSGIWQTVWLESVPEVHIEKIKITPTKKGVVINVYGGADEKKITLSESGEIFTFKGDSVTVEPSELKLWTPDEPNIYPFTLECGMDKIQSYFAVRWVDVKDIDGVKRITLNDKPYLFNGLLDQGYYPDGIYTPATAEAFEDDIKTAKRLGFNMLRKHIKIEPMIFYYLCDTIGIAVFQDMVNNGKYSFIRDTALPTVSTNLCQRLNDEKINSDIDARKIFEGSMYITANLLYNTPSVVYYTIFNEGWGQFTADSMYHKLRKKDSTRVIDTTSGWFRRNDSDVDSRHIYFRKLEPKNLDGRPLVISEFGGYAHPIDGHIYSDKSYGYKTIESQEEFENALIRLYDTEVRNLVASGASAFVYTQISDVEEEVNGLITYDRRALKVNADRLATLNAELRKLSEENHK